MKKILVTGSSGLIGSEVVDYFCRLGGFEVYGVDNNMRAEFFGPNGDTRWRQKELETFHLNFRHCEVDIRNRVAVDDLIKMVEPVLVVHAAAQPSHDLAATIPHVDFNVNAVGTMNMLEATRKYSPEAVFVYMSTNKVYGDTPNFRNNLVELPTRWDYTWGSEEDIDESMSIDQSKHSIFGASKVAADIMVQEYGRYFNMKTCCLRGGCLTGPNHSGVELHGFLSYLIKCNLEQKVYKIYGYKGKQVRDNIHALDVARFIEQFYNAPRCGEVYNIGGGRSNSISIIEAFSLIESISGIKMKSEYVDKNREGDHICYISCLNKMKEHYPTYNLTKSLTDIFEEIYGANRK